LFFYLVLQSFIFYVGLFTDLNLRSIYLSSFEKFVPVFTDCVSVSLSLYLSVCLPLCLSASLSFFGILYLSFLFLTSIPSFSCFMCVSNYLFVLFWVFCFPIQYFSAENGSNTCLQCQTHFLWRQWPPSFIKKWSKQQKIKLQNKALKRFDDNKPIFYRSKELAEVLIAVKMSNNKRET
jgi:hypothetical protein